MADFALIVAALLTTLARSQFTRGALLVLRVAPVSPDTVLSSNGAAILLDEISINGTYIAGPFSVSAAGPDACVLAGNASVEGQLSISADGGSAALACYIAQGGAEDVSGFVPEGSNTIIPFTNFRAVVVEPVGGNISAPVTLGRSYCDPPRPVYGAFVADAGPSASRFYVGGEGAGVKGVSM